MAQENPTQVISELSDEVIQPDRFVKYSATGVAISTAGTDKIAGVCNQDVANTSGDTIPVVIAGTVRVEASASIDKGAYVTATTAGKAIATTTTDDIVRGIAREAAAADGDIIEIQLTYFHHN